jgi:hypothetical protein
LKIGWASLSGEEQTKWRDLLIKE